MASESEASCDGDPNFAVVCGFLERFGASCGLTNIDFLDLQEMLENTHEVAPTLVQLHIKLLRKIRKSVSTERWERAVINICHGYNSQDAWEIERFGYKKARIGSKLRLLKQLLEMQFDLNQKFKNEINKMSATELRTQPLGRDKIGHSYWFQADDCCQVRVYKEDPDEETWALVAKDREGLVSLIAQLGNNGDGVTTDSVTVSNEDSNSLEIEKPILDTGQSSDPNSKSSDTSKKSSEAEEELEADVDEEDDDEEEESSEEEEKPVEKVPKSKEQNEKLQAEVNKVQEVIKEKVEIEESKIEGAAKPETPSSDEKPVELKQESGETKTAEEVSVKKDDEPVNQSDEVSGLPVKKEDDNKPISLRLKPLNELLSGPTHDSEKKVELSGIKEKYIRSDPFTSQTSHRKAVESAGFVEMYKTDLKRSVDYDVVELSILKRPRTDRPTLLGNKKLQKPYVNDEMGEEEEDSFDEDEEDDYDDDIGEEIEEPLMLVKGKGNGKDNNSGNTESPIVGEEIEEAMMLVQGEGSGKECEMGNEKDTEQETPSNNVKNSIKLGMISDSKEKKDNIRCIPKKSRWDLGKPSSEEDGKANVQKLVEKWETMAKENETEPEPTPKPSSFFFGPGSGFAFKSPNSSPSKAAVTFGGGSSEDKVTEPESQGDVNKNVLNDSVRVNLSDRDTSNSETSTDALTNKTVSTEAASNASDISNEDARRPDTEADQKPEGTRPKNNEQIARPNDNVEVEESAHSQEDVSTDIKDNNKCDVLIKSSAEITDGNKVPISSEETKSCENNSTNIDEPNLKCDRDTENIPEKSKCVEEKKETESLDEKIEEKQSPDVIKEKSVETIGSKSLGTTKQEPVNTKEQKSVEPVGQTGVNPVEEKCANTMGEKSVTTKEEKPVRVKEQKSDDAVKQVIADPIEEKSVAAIKKKSVTPTKDKSVSPTKDKSVHAIKETSLTRIEEKTVVTVQEKSDANREEKTIATMEGKSVERIDEIPVATIEDKSVASKEQSITKIENKIVATIEKEAVVARDDKVEDKPAATTKDESAVTTKVKSAGTIEENVFEKFVHSRKQKEIKNIPRIEDKEVAKQSPDKLEKEIAKTSSNKLEKEVAKTSAPKLEREIAKTSTVKSEKEVLKTSILTYQDVLEKEIAKTSSDKLETEVAKTSSDKLEKEVAITSTNKLEKEIAKTSSDKLEKEVTKTSTDKIQVKEAEKTLVMHKLPDKTEIIDNKKTDDSKNKEEPKIKQVEEPVTRRRLRSAAIAAPVEVKPPKSKKKQQKGNPATNENGAEDSKSMEASQTKTESKIDIEKLERQILDDKECKAKIDAETKKLITQTVIIKEPEQSEIKEELCTEKKMELCYEETKKDEAVEKVKAEENKQDEVKTKQSEEEAETKQDGESKNEEAPKEKKITLATLSLDFTEDHNPEDIQEVIRRVTRKRSRGSPIREAVDDNSGGKRRKMRGKRTADLELRRSIEEQKKKELSSSEEEKSEISKSKQDDQPPKKEKKAKKKRRTLMGLDITEGMLGDDTPIGVRQSRRIAQIKIKEEAERRKIEEMALAEIKDTHKKRSKKDEDKDYKAEKRKRNKMVITDDETTNDVESDEKKKKKRKRKRKNPKFDEANPWKSSSDSSSTSGGEEDEEGEYEDDDDDPGSPLFRSDHEFSPESDLENGDIQPLKRARTVKKEDAVEEEEEEVDDTSCQKCGKSDHPEWILLCDGCDSGWHCSCLRPALLVIPEGDWYCPPCQHMTLVKNLQARLEEFDKKISKREIEVRRKERLAYVGISLDNVLPSKEHDETKPRIKHRRPKESDDSVSASAAGSSASGSESGSASGSGSQTETETDSEEEPIYQLRQRRQAHSYRFNDYDELINSAIQEEVDAVKKSTTSVSHGKDMANIVQAETETTVEAAAIVEGEAGIELPPVVPANTDLPPVLTTPAVENSDDEIIRPVRKLIGKKKHRKLNSLDISSEDDHGSDEDFKGSSSDDDDEDFDEDLGSSTDESSDRRRGRKKGPIRRSTRARISRYDRDFINDDSEDDAPKRKRNRSIWDESESEEESDRSWGRRKKRSNASRKSASTSDVKKKRSSKKKKKVKDDSDPEVYKRRKPKIKFGGLESEDEGEADGRRRTRGKKINYIDALGTDSEDEIRRRKTAQDEESEDEFVLNEEGDEHEGVDRDSDDSGDGPTMVGAVIKPGRKKGVGKGGIKRIKRAQGEEEALFPPLEPKLGDAPLLPLELEVNPIEQMNKNIEAMDEKEMEMMMEEEEYANRQLQMVAEQLEKEKRRREMEARRLEAASIVPPPMQMSMVQQVPIIEEKVPKKRGRKPKSMLMNPDGGANNVMYNIGTNVDKGEEFGDVGGMNLNPDGTPKKRRGRGKGKKTLEKEAAAAAAALLASSTMVPSNSSKDSDSSEIPLTVEGKDAVLGGKLGIASAPQPFSQSQPKPSAITRMLQQQPGPTSFPVGALGMKYYADGPEGASPPLSASPQGGPPYTGPPAYRPAMNHYPPVRGAAPPHRLRSPGPQNIPPHVYHGHHPMDPSPSGGGPISAERSSPALVSPSSASPLSNKGDPTPPPPPYVRPPLVRFPPGSPAGMPPRAPLHMMAHMQPRPPYHPGMPPNFHYGPYPPPEEGGPPGQFAPPYPEQYQEGPAEKHYDEENGEFGGLVSYFSSQREDDLDT